MQRQHLQHWGINMMTVEKTEATMIELQIKLNMSYEFDQITEAGLALHPMSGPGCACSLATFSHSDRGRKGLCLNGCLSPSSGAAPQIAAPSFAGYAAAQLSIHSCCPFCKGCL